MNYQQLLKDYLYNQEQKKKYEELEKNIKTQIFESMQNEELDSLEILHPETKIPYIAGYSSRNTKSTDFDLLIETVGEDKFSQIVKDKESVFPIIKKAPKKKLEPIDKSNILKEESNRPEPPKGYFDDVKLA